MGPPLWLVPLECKRLSFCALCWEVNDDTMTTTTTRRRATVWGRLWVEWFDSSRVIRRRSWRSSWHHEDLHDIMKIFMTSWRSSWPSSNHSTRLESLDDGRRFEEGFKSSDSIRVEWFEEGHEDLHDIMKIFMTSWRSSWHHEDLHDIMKIFMTFFESLDSNRITRLKAFLKPSPVVVSSSWSQCFRV